MVATCENVDFELKLDEFKINGYVVFEDMIPHEKLDRIREAFMPLVEHIKARDTEVTDVETGDVRVGMGRQQFKNRYTVTIPWVEPFADPEIYEHPVMLEFLDRYWGTDEYVISCYHSNNPYPGSEMQPWHRDTRLATYIPHVGLENCPVVGVKFPLADTSEENGSIEVLPSTQYLADPSMEGRYNEVLLQGSFPSAQRLNLKKGSMWVQDVRMLHRGTPNRTDTVRPELVVCYCRSWFSIAQTVEMPCSTYHALSDRGQRMLHRRRPVDWD